MWRLAPWVEPGPPTGIEHPLEVGRIGLPHRLRWLLGGSAAGTMAGRLARHRRNMALLKSSGSALAWFSLREFVLVACED
jgi:hypothetical protein